MLSLAAYHLLFRARATTLREWVLFAICGAAVGAVYMAKPCCQFALLCRGIAVAIGDEGIVCRVDVAQIEDHRRNSGRPCRVPKLRH